jgi:subtilisin family serine protease
LAVTAIISLTSLNAAAADAEYIPSEVLVKFKDGTITRDINSLHSTLNVSNKRELSKLKLHRLKLPEGITVEEAIIRYEEDPNVEYAEPNYIVHALATPDDPSFCQLWGLHNTGLDCAGDPLGTSDADIDAPEAWDLLIGSSIDSSNVIIAVVDSGVVYKHPDFSDNIWTNPAEIGPLCTDGIDNDNDDFIDNCDECANGIDDDGNGFKDDCRGWDFVDNDGSPFDLNNHGTHVAGTIAAQGDNAMGITGVMWDAKIMPVRFLGLSGSGSTFNAIASIIYAYDNGARIISNSWGGGWK